MVVIRRTPQAAPQVDPADVLGPVQITAQGVSHSGGFHEATEFSRREVQHLELRVGSPAEWPVLLFLCGAVLALGLPLAILMAPSAVEKGLVDVMLFWAAIGALGILLVTLAVRKRSVLLVFTSPRRYTKLVFPTTIARPAILRFVSAASRRHGYRLVLGRGFGWS